MGAMRTNSRGRPLKARMRSCPVGEGVMAPEPGRMRRTERNHCGQLKRSPPCMLAWLLLAAWVATSAVGASLLGPRARGAERRLLQLTAQEVVQRSKQGKALFPTLQDGSTSEADLNQTQQDADQAFNLGSLGDPMGLLSCVPVCEEGFTCALVASPPCDPNAADNTGTTCPGGSAPSNQTTWTCQACKEGEYCPANSLYTTNDGGRLDALERSPDPLNVSSICPAGSMCPNPAQQLPCPFGRFCPKGSTSSLTCNIPDLLNNNYSAAIWTRQTLLAVALQLPFRGNYCPTNSSTPAALCPPGFFCPTPQQKLPCPEGYYCASGAYAPTKCRALASCPPGTEHPTTYAFGVLVLALGLVIYLLITYILATLSLYMQRSEQAKQTLFSQLFTILNAQLDGKDFSDIRGLPPPDELISLSFDRLSFTLPNGQVVLEGVTGEIMHSRLVAVMGPSGSGKSTFLNALAGRASYGTIGGTVRVNDEVADMRDFRCNIGFVPQDDIVYGDLTVRENLLYSACLRQPPGTASSKIGRLVARAIRALQLGPVQNTVVGSVEKRGISGGQRKRVNVGMELVAVPALLFLDEPTSGLDSTASWDIIHGLKGLAGLRMTVITVIHQPRFSIFNMFDDLLLLGRGGLTVFLGSSWLALPYFSMLGWELPEGENPADFLLDIIAGQEINPRNSSLTNTGLAAEWERKVDEGWVEAAEAEMEVPQQAMQKPRPTEMCMDAVDERRLTLLAVYILGEARRRRILQSRHGPGETGGAEHPRGPQGAGVKRTPSRQRVTPEMVVTEEELRLLMEAFSLEVDDAGLERTLVRAGLAYRKGDGQVTVAQLIRFMVVDYQLQISSMRATNRKILIRQRTLMTTGNLQRRGLSEMYPKRELDEFLKPDQDNDPSSRGTSVSPNHQESGLLPGSLTPPGVNPRNPKLTRAMRMSPEEHVSQQSSRESAYKDPLDTIAESPRVPQRVPPGSGLGLVPSETLDQADLGDRDWLEGRRSAYLSGADEHQSEGFRTPDESSAGSDPPSPRGAGFDSSDPQCPVASPFSLPAPASEPSQENEPPVATPPVSTGASSPLGASSPPLVPSPSPPVLNSSLSIKKSVRLQPVGEHMEIPLASVAEAETPREPLLEPRPLPKGPRPLTVPHVSSAPASLGRDSSGSVSSGVLPYGRQISGLMKSPFETMDHVEPFSMPPPRPPNPVNSRIKAKAQSMPPPQPWGLRPSSSLKPAMSGMEPYKRLHSNQEEDDEAVRSKDGWLSTAMRAAMSGLQWAVLPVLAGTTKWDQLISSRLRRRKGTNRVPPGTLQQLYFVTARSFIQYLRHLDEAFVDSLLSIGVAYILGLLSVNSVEASMFPVTAVTSCLAFALLSASGSLKVFSRYKVVFEREAWAGLRPLPYFLGRAAVDLINVAFRPFLFTITLSTALHAKAPVSGYYMTMLMVSWWVSTSGYAISIFCSGNQALMVHVISILIFGILIAGVNSPTLVTMYREMPYLWVISGLSYNRWAVEAITIHDFQNGDPIGHHLGLSTLLNIGFCNNQAYGMPSFETLSMVFMNSTGIKSFTEGLDHARPILGAPVVDTLVCTFDTRVTKERDINCVTYICGGRIGVDWAILFAIGCGFAFLAYLGLAEWARSMWRVIRFTFITTVEVGVLGWLRPMVFWVKETVKGGLRFLVEACIGEGKAPSLLQPSMDTSAHMLRPLSGIFSRRRNARAPGAPGASSGKPGSFARDDSLPDKGEDASSYAMLARMLQRPSSNSSAGWRRRSTASRTTSEEIGSPRAGSGEDPHSNGGLKKRLMRWSMQLGLAPAHVSTVPSVVVEHPSEDAEEGTPQRRSR